MASAYSPEVAATIAAGVVIGLVLGIPSAAWTRRALQYCVEKCRYRLANRYRRRRPRRVPSKHPDADLTDLPLELKSPDAADYASEIMNLNADFTEQSELQLKPNSLDIPDYEIMKLDNLNEIFVGANVENQCCYNQFIGADQGIAVDTIITNSQVPRPLAYVRAGPRAILYFDPEQVIPAIVTCGGLCPGLNNVIRGITKTLVMQYKVKKIMGVIGGFNGFVKDEWIELTRDSVRGIHHLGGTVLGTSRGGFDLDGIMRFIERHGVNHLYVIGGDGTHRGAYKVFQEAQRRGIPLAVGGIPKTIDNDIDLIDRTFGFSTSVEAAQLAIRSAKVEAMSNRPNGIGVVKLMGRHSGFLTSHACLSSGDANLCLIPEEAIDLPVILEHVEAVLKRQGHVVIVVAEGAGEEICADFNSGAVDKSGNRALPPIGEVLTKHIKDYFAQRGREYTLKYIDPSYTVRACPANASDGLYCLMLAQNVVHGCMAGYTGFTVGLVNNRMVLLPIPQLCENSPRFMNPNGRTWERVLTETGQPKAESEGGIIKSLSKETSFIS